jgi:hypothetical protein
MGSKRKNLLISILIAIILTVCFGTIWSLFKSYQLRRTPQLYSSNKLTSAKGWKVSQSRGDKKIYRASVEDFSIDRAKLGPFTIGPLQVAHLKEVVIDFYSEGLLSDEDADTNPSKPKTFRIDALEGPLADIRNDLLFRSRRIRILDIDGISLNLWEKEKRVFNISSDKATMDRQTGDIVFIGHASMDAAENGSIISYRIRWIKKTSLFHITDPFILTNGNKKKEGRELETDYLLKKIRYQIKS